MKETMYMVWLTIMSITTDFSGKQECINNPINCLTYKTSVVRFNYRDKDKALLFYHITQKDTLMKNTFYANVVTKVKLDSIQNMNQKEIDDWIKRSGEVYN